MRDDAVVTDRPDYLAVPATVLSRNDRRDVAMRRLRSWVGSVPDTWPVALMALTANALLIHRLGERPQVDVTVHADGDFSATIRAVDLSMPVRSRLSFADGLRSRMWWETVTSPLTVAVCGGLEPAAPLDELVGEYGQRCVAGVDVTVRVACDPEVVGPGPEAWWNGWFARLPELMTVLEINRLPGWRIAMHDEISGGHGVFDSPCGR
jgi:hypothetical protein